MVHHLSRRGDRHGTRPEVILTTCCQGCGTGQQSISAAQGFGDGAMLAVDLSVASLAYAKRKSAEYGLQIEYGQADILELASLAREFDVIESIGNQSTRELSLAVIRLMLEGKAGSTLTLSVVRPLKPDPDKITLTRTMAAEPVMAQQDYENSTILYLKPGVLTAARVDEIAAKIKSAGKSIPIAVVMLKADLTDAEAPGWELLRKLNPSGGIPLTAIYAPRQPDPTLIASIYTKQTLIDTLDKVTR